MRQQLFSAIEKRVGKYITIHFRPIYSSGFNRESFPTPSLPSYAVVVHGPIVTKNDFTLETLKIYKKIFLGAPLIVSTWDDAPADAVGAMRAIPGVEVVLQKLPGYRGFGNSNYQITGTATGIRKAEELGAKYVFKTRSDQRVYATDIFPFLYSLIESFPLAKLGVQKQRLIALGYSTIKYRPYSLNDMFFFGTIDDMKLYWDIPHDTRPSAVTDTIGQWQQGKFAEGYFLTTFLKRIGHDTKDTLEDFWDVLGKYFILVDASDLDWYWFKYKRYQEYHYRKYDKVIVGEEVNFKQWLIFARGLAGLERKPTDLAATRNDTHETKVKFEK